MAGEVDESVTGSANFFGPETLAGLTSIYTPAATMAFPPRPPAFSPGFQALLWGVLLGAYIWIGGLAVGVGGGTAFLFGADRRGADLLLRPPLRRRPAQALGDRAGARRAARASALTRKSASSHPTSSSRRARPLGPSPSVIRSRAAKSARRRGAPRPGSLWIGGSSICSRYRRGRASGTIPGVRVEARRGLRSAPRRASGAASRCRASRRPWAPRSPSPRARGRPFPRRSRSRPRCGSRAPPRRARRSRAPPRRACAGRGCRT